MKKWSIHALRIDRAIGQFRKRLALMISVSAGHVAYLLTYLLHYLFTYLITHSLVQVFNAP